MTSFRPGRSCFSRVSSPVPAARRRRRRPRPRSHPRTRRSPRSPASISRICIAASRRRRPISASTSTTTSWTTTRARAVTDAVAAARGFRQRVEAIDAAALNPANQLDREQLLRAIDSRILSLDVIRSVGEGSRHLQQRHHQHRLPDDQAGLRAARRTAAAAHRPRKGHARGAGRGAQEPREPAEDLYRDRDRTGGRQPGVLQDGGGRGLPRGQGQGPARRVQGGQRRR